MRIKLLSDFNGAASGSICEADQKQSMDLIEKGIAVADQSTDENVSDEVSRMAEQRIMRNTKMEKKDIGSEFVVGKAFQAIYQKAITGANEATAADGGNIVYTGLAEIAPLLMHGSKVYAKCRRIPIAANANAMKVPFSNNDWYVKAAAPVVSGSVAEGIAGTDTKMVFGARTLTLAKAIVPVAVTAELMEDAPSVDAFIRAEMVAKLGTILDYEILKGGGCGFSAVIGDTGYTATSTISSTTTLAEIQTLKSKVHPALSPEVYCSITAWNKLVATFGTYNNVMMQLIDIAGMKILGMQVNVMPFLAATDLIIADMSQYTVVEGNLGQRLAVSVDARFLYDEVCFKLTSRQAGAITLPVRNTVDSLTVGGFVTNA